MRASQEYNRTAMSLPVRWPMPFARYQSQRVLLDYYRTQILQDQVQSYVHLPAIPAGRRQRCIQRRRHMPADIASAVSTYIQALGDQWQSMVEMAGLLQLDDLSQLDQFADTKMPLCRVAGTSVVGWQP